MADGDRIQATPRNPWLGALASGLDALRSAGNYADLRSVIPAQKGSALDKLLPAQLPVGDLLFGKAPEEVNDWSYGNAPLRIPANTNIPQQSRPGRVDQMVDTALAAPMVASGAKLAGKGALSLLDRALAPVPRSLAQQGAIRLRGGNMDAGSVESYLDNLKAYPDEGTAQPHQQWMQKQLRNYLMKDIGSPADPLLQVEKEIPGLHLPEGWQAEADLTPETFMNVAATISKDNLDPRSHIGRHLAATDQPITPWGIRSDETVAQGTVGDRLKNPYGFDKNAPENAWMQKADPSTPMYALDDRARTDLGFDHVVDYLKAAQGAERNVQSFGGADAMRTALADQRVTGSMRPEARAEWERSLALHDAGLTLNADQIGKTSVADAVRKTAKWNEVLANKMNGPAHPDLARGIANVHKEYPEDGMKWVQLGESKLDKLPEGYRVQQTPGRKFHQIVDKEGKNVDGETLGYESNTPEEAVQNYLTKHPRKDLSAGLNAEGNAMGHCVGGYCEDVAERGTQIYSLRDKNGNPHVTVEVAPRYKSADEALWATLKDVHGTKSTAPGSDYALYKDFMQAFAGKLNKDISFDDLNAFLEKQGRASITNPIDIHQIKGKQNAAPVEKYKKYVQDFVKSGQWGKVGDLRNTGLVDANTVQEEVWRAARHWPDNGRTFKLPDDTPQYLTPEEVAAIRKNAGFAQGGSVDPACGCPYAAARSKFKGYKEGGVVVKTPITELRAKLAARISAK